MPGLLGRRQSDAIDAAGAGIWVFEPLGQRQRPGQRVPPPVIEEPGLFKTMYSSFAMRRLHPEPVPEEHRLRLIDAATPRPRKPDD